MFRRFMIVWWVLFALSSLSAGAGLIYHEKFERQLLTLLTEELTFNFALQRDGERLMRSETEFADMTPEERDAVTYAKRAHAVQEMQSNAQTKATNCLSFAFLAGFGAVAILIWNIIWHVGHWVRVGRESHLETKS